MRKKQNDSYSNVIHIGGDEEHLKILKAFDRVLDLIAEATAKAIARQTQGTSVGEMGASKPRGKRQ